MQTWTARRWGSCGAWPWRSCTAWHRGPSLWGSDRSFLFRTIRIMLQVIAASVGRAFGPEYFAPNFGLFFTTTLIYYPVIIIISQVWCHHTTSAITLTYHQLVGLVMVCWWLYVGDCMLVIVCWWWYVGDGMLVMICWWSPGLQVDVLFNIIGYSGMFLMAGGIGACGAVVTFLMAEDIKYERARKGNLILREKNWERNKRRTFLVKNINKD